MSFGGGVREAEGVPLPALSIKIRASGRKRLLRSLSLKGCHVQRNVRLKHVGARSSKGGGPAVPGTVRAGAAKGTAAQRDAFLPARLGASSSIPTQPGDVTPQGHLPETDGEP